MIEDPHFYIWAIPAVLLVGLAKSGFLSGFGAVATPLMAMAVPVPQAAAIMLPLLCLMDLASLQQLWKERDAPLLRHRRRDERQHNHDQSRDPGAHAARLPLSLAHVP